MTTPRSHFRQPKQLDAGILQAEINSFALRLAAEGKAAETMGPTPRRSGGSPPPACPGTPAGPAGSRSTGCDIQRWMAWLLDRYSSAYASNQYRALQQFFKWLAAEDELPDPMAGLQPPRVTDKLVPVFTPEELARLEEDLYGPQLRAAPRYRDHRGIHRDRHPASRASRPAGRGTATSTCGSGRSPSAARAAKTGSSRSATRPPGTWTGSSAPAPATPRPGDPSSGSEHGNRGP